jgi:hypothetical protein
VTNADRFKLLARSEPNGPDLFWSQPIRLHLWTNHRTITVLVSIVLCVSPYFSLPLVGLETTSKTPEKQGVVAQSGTDSGTLQEATNLEALAAELAKLPPAERARLAAMLLGEQVAPAPGTR